VIGRDPACDLSVQDPGWSRRHAQIDWIDDGFIVSDLGSRNGIYVNGRRVHKAPLLVGTVITIGGTDLVLSVVRDSPLPDFTGCVVDGRYRLVKLLRESAKGAVYAGEYTRMSGEVAVKLLSPDLVRYAGYRDSFHQEAAIAARLRHPHICAVIDYGSTTLHPPGGGTIETQFLCYEMMTGGSLARRLDADEAVAVQRIAEWLTAIASALDFAHRRGVLHGDVKPSAIVFDEDDHPYLTDFSIAREALSAEGGPVVGTPAYMAPEVWDGGDMTAGSDQFALAAIVYYLVTGARPFEGQDNPEVRRRNFRRGVIAAHEEAAHNKRARLPRAVSAVLARALAADPADRFESSSAFASAFKAALRHITPSSGQPEAFISYQRETSAPLAMYFADRLKAQGINAFIDTEGIDRAGRFPPQIERAIEDTDVFICLLADTTLQSGYVVEEIRAAHRFEKPMIPVMQESFGAPPRAVADEAVAALLAHQGLPVLDRRNLHLEHTATDLVRLVKSAIAQRDRD
jgi:serine/threonine protein kinase